MSVWILDTDILSLLLGGNDRVRRHAAAVTPEDLAITIITVEEMLSGWYTQIRRSQNDEEIVRAYTALQEAVQFVSQIRILPFDPPASSLFRELRSLYRRVGTNDLRIASIVIKQEGILVTRNVADFREVPELQMEDWSR